MPTLAQHSSHPSRASPSTYGRRRPETTILYEVINEHLEAFLRQARERNAKGLPRYVTSELRAYLRCGILAHGFLHARCKDCHREMVVAFSCKRRGACPSCNPAACAARRPISRTRCSRPSPSASG